MPVSEAKKRANAKWNKNNRRNASVTLSMQQYNKLMQYVSEHNISASGLIKDRIKDIID